MCVCVDGCICGYVWYFECVFMNMCASGGVFMAVCVIVNVFICRCMC